MAGMRDILIHAYDSIDSDEVWDEAIMDLPGICLKIKEIIDSSVLSNRVYSLQINDIMFECISKS
jgi:uncharacterized protein with HEPN domain